MPGFRRGVAGHTIVARSFTGNTIHRRKPPFLKFPNGPPSNSNAGGKKKGQGQPNTPASTPPTAQLTPPSNPAPNNGGGISLPSGNGSPAPVPPAAAVPQNFGTGSGDAPLFGSQGGSTTTSSRAVPSTVTGGAVTPTTSNGSLGADNLGSGTNDPSPSSGGSVANAGDVPTNTQDSLSQLPGGSSTLGVVGSSPTTAGNDANNTTSAAAAADQGHLSTGAVVTIVILFIALFLALLVFVLRRRSRARRIEEANMWWFARRRTSKTYGDRNSAEILPSPRSARSSFATTLDHSVHAFPAIPSPLPPMAEVGRANASSRHHTEFPEHRFSLGSNHSDDSQFLFVDLRNSSDDHAATIGHSPSQSFAFPKPPSPIASAYSRSSGNKGTSATTKRPNSGDILYPAYASVPPTPAAVPLIGDDPFASKPVSNPFRDNNPFEDPQHPAAPTILTTAFAEEETTHGPFQRTPQDEVTVSTIDCLRESGPASIADRHVSSYGDEGTFTAM